MVSYATRPSDPPNFDNASLPRPAYASYGAEAAPILLSEPARPTASPPVRRNSGFTESSAPASSAPGGYGVSTGLQSGKRRTMRLRSSQAVPHGWATIRTPAQLGFLGVIVVQAIAVLALIIVVFVRFDDALVDATLRLRAIIVYLVLFIMAVIFSVIITSDSLRTKNTMQLYGIDIFLLLQLIYAALMGRQISDALNVSDCLQVVCSNGAPIALFDTRLRGPTIAIPCVIGVALLLCLGLSYRLTSEFNWTQFKIIGADLRLIKAYRLLLIQETLLRFLAFFLGGFCAQFIVLSVGQDDAEFGITIAALPIVLLVIFAMPFIYRREILSAAWALFALELAGLAYVIFKIVRLFQPSQAYRYEASRRSLAVFSITTLILLLGTIVLSVLITLSASSSAVPANQADFGKGLKAALPKSTLSSSRPEKVQEKPELDPIASRISID